MSLASIVGTKQESNEALAAMVKANHDPALKREHTVVRIWGDGEVTYEKGGELYGKRTIHMIYPSLPGANFVMPEKTDGDAPVGYAIVTSEAAVKIRELMRAIIKGQV